MVKKIYSVLFVLFFITSVQSVSAQEVCPSGNECSWIGTTDVTQFGVKPSASAQGFWNDQVTKDKLCQLSGYERNPGFDWAVRQGKWNKCNAEYHVDWRGVWDSHKCGGDSYVTAVYCTRNIPAPAEPTLSFSANPTAVTPFGKTTLTWSAQNVTSCTASGDWSGSKGFSGSEETSMLVFGDKTFTLTCSGSGGSVSKDVNVSLYVVPSAPTISWTSAPATVSSGAGYTISAKGEDADGNLVSVVIKKAGASFASSGAGDGMSSTASAQSVDAGPATITYTAQATDSTNRVSSEIEHTVSVTGIMTFGGTTVTTGDAVTIVPVTASVSVSPSCVAPGDTISVSGSASGGLLNGVSTITSNELQKDSNKDGVFGVIASRSDAGNTSANVSVPAGETSNRYDFKTRVASNGSFVESSVMSVTIDPSCGQPSTLCSVFPFLCNSVTPPATPVSNSVSLSVNPSCALPGSTVSFSSTAGGSITSHIIEKDSNQDGVYGTLASLSSGPGTKTHSDSFSEGTYDFRAVINGSVYSSPARIQVSPSCQPSQPPAVVGGGFPGFGGGFGGSGGSGGSVVAPPPVIVRSFTLTASPSSVKVKSVAGYSGSVEQTIDISVNPVNFNSPVSIEATDIPSDLKPEFSFNNGPFSENVIAPATLNSGGLQYMPVKIRFAGKVPSGSFTIGFRGTGGNLSQTTYVTFDSRPLIPGYIEI